VGARTRLLLQSGGLLAGLTVVLLATHAPHFWLSFGALAVGVAYVVVFGVFGAKYGIADFEQFFSEASIVFPIVIWAISGIIFGLVMGGNRAGTIGFHAAAAQLIPVLVLAIALQGRTFDIRVVRRTSDLYLMILTFAALADGEFYALKSLYTDKPTSADLVAAAITAGFGALVLRGLGAGAALRQPEPEDQTVKEGAAPPPTEATPGDRSPARGRALRWPIALLILLLLSQRRERD
jgi:hypothetical protein